MIDRRSMFTTMYHQYTSAHDWLTTYFGVHGDFPHLIEDMRGYPWLQNGDSLMWNEYDGQEYVEEIIQRWETDDFVLFLLDNGCGDEWACVVDRRMER